MGVGGGFFVAVSLGFFHHTKSMLEVDRNWTPCLLISFSR